MTGNQISRFWTLDIPLDPWAWQCCCTNRLHAGSGVEGWWLRNCGIRQSRRLPIKRL